MAEHKEEVVISGIGGMFPESDNLEELKDLLFNETNGITLDSRRWNPNELGVSSGTGKIKTLDNFDATFFSVHPKLAEVMDVLTRLSLERSIEAIIDAGLSPTDLHGTNTAVFMGSAINETEMLIMDASLNSAFSMLGRSRTMQANRVSYILNLTGPSFSMDGGWLCGSNGLQKAKEMIEDGIISTAIVGVTNLVLRPEIQFQFHGLNRLNKSIHTKTFSNNADGYNRSEACIVMLLQKASEAKRSYGTLVGIKSMQFGDHQGQIIDHIENNFKSVLLDCYKEANINPSTVEYIEAYGSGIKSEDNMELNVMEEVFCTAQRKTPLKIGSVKSNVGHCEASGLFMSIIKTIIAFESGYIPPNINYTEPYENAAGLKNGKIQVVTEKTALVGDTIGISSFGNINSFSHVILRRNNKVKNDTKDINDTDYIPRIMLASGRNEENARETIKKIKIYGSDAEFITLTNNVFSKNINSHFYRCFSIYPILDETRIDDVWNVTLKKRPVWFIFSGMGSQWHGMGLSLMKLPVFANAINICDSVLKPRGINIINILTSQNPKLFNNILNSFVGIAAIQIGLVEVLKVLDIVPDGIIGHSVGELGCAYADGCFTIEEMILSAYARGRASIETELIPGMMAAIGLGYHDIKDRLPHDIDVACHNSNTSCTISGPVNSINTFVSKLKSEGIFAKAVNVAGIAFHSRYIQTAGPTLLKYLKEVIKEPKTRSSKWVCSSLPETEWNKDLAKYSSPEYHTNNLLSSVLFEDALKHIPSDAITIEIAPHGLLQSIIVGALPDTVTNIPLTKKMFGDSVRFLLNAIGKMYTSGLSPKVEALYPKITFPVSRGTPSIKSLPFWDTTHKWPYTASLNSLMSVNSCEKIFSLVLHENIHLAEYQIHGHHIIPLSFILFNIWTLFNEMNGKQFSDEPIQFNNLRMKNNIEIHKTNSSDSYIMIQSGSGFFEYNLENEVILSGQIVFTKNIKLNTQIEISKLFDKTSDDFQGQVFKDEIYDILDNNGFNMGDNFKNIVNFEVYKKDIQGYVKWKNDWIYFLDGLFKFPLLENLSSCLIETPVSIRQININPSMFANNTEEDVCVNYNIATKLITCKGIQISDVVNGPLILSKQATSMVRLEEQTFIQFEHQKCKDINDFIYDSMDIIMESDKFDFDTETGKLILCTPYHYDDTVSKICTKTIKQIVENHLSTNSVTMNWDNVKNVSADDESGRFISVTNVRYIQDTMKALANKTHSFIVVCSKQKIKDYKDWKIIIQQQINNIDYLALMRKEIILDGKCIFIKPTNDDYDQSIWKAIEKYKSFNGMIYIISNSEPLEGVNIHVKEMLMKYRSKKLRFIFILDSNAPKFDLNKSFYTNQLTKGMIVNIYKNNGWGSYKRIVVKDLNSNMMVTNYPALKHFSTNDKNKLTVKCLGLNFKDLVVEDHTKNEFGPLEYSGLFENNKTVMGIAFFKEISLKIEYDSILSWPVPLTWSLEDAATVPLAYALSYYIFKILCSLQKDKSVLVTSGLHPIGQAAISIGLAEKCQVYAIVESSKEVDQLSNIFPKLPRSRILVNTNNKFDIELMFMTKSKGIDFVLNLLNGEAFQAAFRTIAYHGMFFHLSKSDLKNYTNFGTRSFLKNTSFTIVSSNMLLNESNRNKEIVQQSFLNGLNNGVVKPFYKCNITMPFNSDEIFDVMRTASASTTHSKVVLAFNSNSQDSKLSENLKYDTYQCHRDHVYVIVGNKSDWLDLAEWLVDRGAQKIVIVVKRCLISSTNCRRFDRIISRNVSVQFETDLCLKTREETINWLNRLTSSNVLGSIFIIKQLDNTKVNNLRHAFEEQSNKTISTSFVCISCKGEQICAELKSIGLNALNISWDGISSQPKNTAHILSSLDTLLQKSNTIEASSFVCSEKGTNKLEWSQQINNIITNFFPESNEELNLLNDKITKEAGFVEVQTKSPRYSQLKSVTPVFIIPGFKPKLMEKFYKTMFYPAFEAQLPEEVNSIDELSKTLVDKLKIIADQSNVSLIGESWGGIVALKMAQLLEAQGILVTVSLLEGDPKSLTDWAESFLSNDNFINRLNKKYSSFSNEFSKYTLEKCEEEYQLLKMSSYQQMLKENTQRAINWIRSCLHALLDMKPLSNKLHTKVLIFRCERTIETNTNLNDYCTNSPIEHNIAQMDYKNMLADKNVIEIITKNVVYQSPNGIEIPLVDKYKNFYLTINKILNI